MLDKEDVILAHIVASATRPTWLVVGQRAGARLAGTMQLKKSHSDAIRLEVERVVPTCFRLSPANQRVEVNPLHL